MNHLVMDAQIALILELYSLLFHNLTLTSRAQQLHGCHEDSQVLPQA